MATVNGWPVWPHHSMSVFHPPTDPVENARVVDKLPAYSERQVVIDVDHRALADIVARLSPLVLMGMSHAAL